MATILFFSLFSQKEIYKDKLYEGDLLFSFLMIYTSKLMIKELSLLEIAFFNMQEMANSRTS